MARPVGVSVVGLRAFQQRVAQAAVYEPKMMREGLNEFAQIIVDEAISEMKSQFVTDPSRRDGKLEDSIRALSTARSARVAMGSPKRVPYAGWWEFGGPRAKSNRPPNRQFYKHGRVLYPTVKRNEAKLLALMEKFMREMAQMIEGG